MRGRVAKNLIGQRFGRWTVVARAGSYTNNNCGLKTSIPQWVCECDCGTVAIVLSTNLKSGASKSCGCYRDDLLKARRHNGDGKAVPIPSP